MTDNTADAAATTTAKPKKPPTEITPVTMEDARVVEFAGKRRIVKESADDGGIPVVRINFRNGKVIVFKCPPDLIVKAAAHGLEQKLGDEAAGEDDVDDQYEAILALSERLAKGGKDAWTVKTGGSGASGTSVLVRALMEAYGKTAEQIRAFLADKDQKQKMALRNSDKLKPIVQRLEQEKAAKQEKAGEGVDVGGMLATLE